MSEPKQHTCAYCQAVFSDHAGRYANLVPNQLVLRRAEHGVRPYHGMRRD